MTLCLFPDMVTTFPTGY